MDCEFKFPVVAFGSNTNFDDLNDYALQHGYPAGCLRFSKLVHAPDHKLAFTKYSQGRSGGVLDLIHSIGHVTTVALCFANEAGLKLLRRKEGVPYHYVEENITVIDENGNEVQALTYVVAANKRERFVRPSEEYLHTCKQGFANLGICVEQLEAAAEDKSIQTLSALFTYGTLMRDQPRFEAISRYGLDCALTASCFGTLSTNKFYPALNLEGDGFSRGDYLVSKDISNLLSLTDEIEGFRGFGAKQNLFRRTCVSVDVGGSGQRFSWLYVRNKEFDTKLPNNDWRSFLGTRQAFSEALLHAHAANTKDFYQKLTKNYARYGSLTTLSCKLVIDLLDQETELTERHLAQISNNWVALTNKYKGT